MDKQIVVNSVILFLSKVAVVPIAEIRPYDTLDTLGVDSAAVISLSSYLEEQFGVISNPEDLPPDATIDQIAEAVARKHKG